MLCHWPGHLIVVAHESLSPCRRTSFLQICKLHTVKTRGQRYVDYFKCLHVRAFIFLQKRRKKRNEAVSFVLNDTASLSLWLCAEALNV